MKKPNILTVKEKSDEFMIRIQNKYSQLVDNEWKHREFK